MKEEPQIMPIKYMIGNLEKCRKCDRKLNEVRSKFVAIIIDDEDAYIVPKHRANRLP